MIAIQKPLPQPGTQPKTLRVAANIISYICHPVFMPIVMAYVVYKLMPAEFVGLTPKQVGLLFINIGYTTAFFPLFSIFLMRKLSFISSYRMPEARERTGPLMAIMIFYFWVSHVFNSMPGIVPFGLKVLLLGNFWGIILLFMANIFTKVSMHTAAAGGIVGILLVLMIVSPANMALPLLIAIIVAGIMGKARMILGVHQRGDIWLGYIIGVVVQLGAYVYMK